MEFVLLAIIILLPIVTVYQWVKLRKLKKLLNTSTPSLSSSAINIDDIKIPEYRFLSSKKYKAQWDKIKTQQKDLKQSKGAVIIGANWVVGLDKKADKEGEKLISQTSDLMLLAFDSKCDEIISNVSFRNKELSENKIKKAFLDVNKNSSTIALSISDKYLKLKLSELKVAFGYEQKLQQEKEQQRAIQEQMAQERREQAAINRAKEKALREEKQAQKDKLEKEKEIAAIKKQLAKDKENAELQAQIARLQAELERSIQIIEDSKRAISMAEQTKMGTVYVISNIGSFGNKVYKIGMTRRLEPMERVKELGDASVPFPFDVHAFIRTEDAPALENALHKAFANNQVNRVNARKEFFEIEKLDDVMNQVKKLDKNAEVYQFSLLAEAAEYYQSLEMKKNNQYSDVEETDEDETYFADQDGNQ